jgi:hypothetical protein
MRYRLNRPTLGLCSDDQRKACVTVPANEIVEVQVPDILARKHTVEIRWGNRVLTMFTGDILERGIPIDDPQTEDNSSRAASYHCSRVASRHDLK